MDICPKEIVRRLGESRYRNSRHWGGILLPSCIYNGRFLDMHDETG